MKSPSEIAAQGVRDELHARAAFRELIKLAPAEVRVKIEADSSLQTDAMALQILNHCDTRYTSLPQEHALELVLAANIAAKNADPHLRLRIAKDIANAFRYLGRFADAAESLRCADRHVERTFAPAISAAAIEFGWIALLDDTDQRQNLEERVERTILGFERSGAADRAYQVRLYDAGMKYRRGEFVAALASSEDAAQRARVNGSIEGLARAQYNIGQCYRFWGDFSKARAQFAEAASTYIAAGLMGASGRSLRNAARMAIRLHGEMAVIEMEPAKQMFLKLGFAGEVCRSTLAVIEELLHQDRTARVAGFCAQFEDEVASLGLLSQAGNALRRLKEALDNGQVDHQLLTNIWDAFGQTYGLDNLSAMGTVRN